MKSVRKICAIVILGMMLTVTAMAGEIGCPGVTGAPPPPPPPGEIHSTDRAASVDNPRANNDFDLTATLMIFVLNGVFIR